MKSQTLSAHLTREAGKFSLFPEKPRTRADREAGALVRDVVREVLESREWVSKELVSSFADPVERNRDVWRIRYDEHYSRELLRRVPKMVERTLSLSRLEASQTPAQATNLYIREATRCYILGLWAGCAALARAALEYALREKVDAAGGGAPATLGRLLEAAARLRILDGPHLSLASVVKTGGDRVLHGGRASDTTAANIVAALSGVVLYLYR